MQFARNWSNIAVRKINYLIKLNPKVKRTAITAFLAIGALLASGSMSAQSFDSELKIEFLTPKTIKWMSDSSSTNIKNAENLLKEFDGQVSVSDPNYATLRSTDGKTASILLDFGKEIHGGIEIASAIRPDQKPLQLRVCYGESVTEAMSSVDNPGKANPTNDHAMRDFVINAPWLGTVRTGSSGFRFVRIDLLSKDTDYNLRAVRAMFQYRDIPYLGSFRSSDERLNKIWQTGAYTVHLNMQEMIWDGIKRDRLVWIGDINPEIMTINNVFGHNSVWAKSFDFEKKDTPLPGWMNGMCSYSLWWLITHRDLYLYQGDKAYLAKQQEYIRGLVKQIISKIDNKGVEHLDGKRFLDWPTSENKDIINSGLHSLTRIALEAAGQIFTALDDTEYATLCANTVKKLQKVKISSCDNKQAAALAIISGMSRNPKKDVAIILKDGPNGFSTFYGYYMLEALAQQGKYAEAMDIMSKYWGAMLDLGATTFWEDLKYSDVANAGRIDEFVPSNKYDIHSGGGAYCYIGLRLSLCHGWASGPTAWLTRYVLGIRPLEPGCSVIEVAPHLGNLEFAEGSFPTPKGVVKVSHRKDANGKVMTTIDAPEGVKVIRK